jgi:hypothetical protein
VAADERVEGVGERMGGRVEPAGDVVTLAIARPMLFPMVGGPSTATTPSAVTRKIIW